MSYRMAAALTSLVGVFVAAYLYLYKIGRIGTMACGTGGCEVVQSSRWASFLGIEVSLIGLLGYVALLAVALAGLQPAWRHRAAVPRLLVGLSGVGVAFALYLTALELFVIHAICRWCVGSAVLITAVFVFSLLDYRRFSSGRMTPPAPLSPS